MHLKKVKETTVIEVTYVTGSGESDADPVREIVEYWLPNGACLTRNDPIFSRYPQNPEL